MGSWSEKIWVAGKAGYEKILGHPFLTELADGSLSSGRFSRYLAQDELYLPVYSSLMHRLADMLPDEADRVFMHRFADAGGESEMEMHRILIGRFHVDTSVAPSPVTQAYCRHLQDAVAGGNPAVAAAALLPCSWVYNNVALHIRGIARLGGNPYREWISEYGDAEYGRTVERMVGITDALAARATAVTVLEMDRAFLRSLDLEYDFWDYGYKTT